LVAAVVARLGGHLLERVLLGDRGAEHRGEGHAEPGDRGEQLADRPLLVALELHGEPLGDLPAAGRLGELLAQPLLAGLVVLALSHRWPPVRVPKWSGYRWTPRAPCVVGRVGAAARAAGEPGSRRRRRRTPSRRRRRPRTCLWSARVLVRASSPAR